ncbi:LysR family transcriptional regulator [Paraburkholderia acidicola]|uniref:LysR family transcriptional regulator n=1 Tax=Paraburkholderia acidicola TaxID=1912599 RepID=A0A2A4EQZ6_9BURK|nr:LysR family transcriptional regulator [Paraburkholderia acidicola]PCE23107.1 LysR family transcriptional regulator [Paraburkholderia acidicola]
MNRTALSELSAVAAVAAHRSFRSAAKELGMSPSALSHAVAALEQRMGVRLFHRTTRSVSLTEAGEQFLARVSPALREIPAAMDEANTHRATPTGTLRINASEGAATRLMNPVGYEFLCRCPDMKLDIVTDARMVDIVAEGFDAGVRQIGQVPQDMIAVPCSQAVRFVVVGAPAYFAKHKKPRVPDDLRAHVCIRARLPGGAPYKWEFCRRGERVQIEVNGALTLDSPNLMLDAALHGVGLAWMSEWAVAAEIAAGRLVQVLDAWSEEAPGLCLYYPGHRHVPAGLRAFIEVVREFSAEDLQRLR